MTRGNDGREAELRAELKQVVPDPPVDAVDWAALHGRIMARSAPLLADIHVARPGVSQTLAGWSRRAIPLATAAAAAAVVLVVGYGPDRPAAAQQAALPTVEDALAQGLRSGSASVLHSGATDDDVLAALLFYEEGEQQ